MISHMDNVSSVDESGVSEKLALVLLSQIIVIAKINGEEREKDKEV